MKTLKSVFIGESLFSLEMLRTLLLHGYNIVSIIGRHEREGVDDCKDLSGMAQAHGIPFRYTENINDEAEYIKALNPDIIYCLGFRQIVRNEILDICPVIGFHPSPLPLMRGHHPIVWALVMKLKVTASTFFLLDEGIDSGDILSQEFIRISKGETVRSLYQKIINAARNQILTLDPSKKTPQDHSQATYLRKRKKGQEDVWLEY